MYASLATPRLHIQGSLNLHLDNYTQKHTRMQRPIEKAANTPSNLLNWVKMALQRKKLDHSKSVKLGFYFQIEGANKVWDCCSGSLYTHIHSKNTGLQKCCKKNTNISPIRSILRSYQTNAQLCWLYCSSILVLNHLDVISHLLSRFKLHWWSPPIPYVSDILFAQSVFTSVNIWLSS